MPYAHIRSIAALGSSYAAGPGIKPLADRRAYRSARNYPHLLAERLGATLTDLTVSGATTDTIIDTPQRLLLHTFPPQLNGLPADADLVTITAGGNDLGYIGSMVLLGAAGRLSSRALSRPLATALKRRGVPRPSEDDIDRAAANLSRIVEETRTRAKHARVLLVDYLTVIGPDTRFSRETPSTKPPWRSSAGSATRSPKSSPVRRPAPARNSSPWESAVASTLSDRPNHG